MIDPPESAQGNLLHNVVLFARVLRRAGVPVSAAAVYDLVRSLEFIDIGNRAEVKDVSRALLVRRREEIPIFDRAFDLFWRRRSFDYTRAQEAVSLFAPRPRTSKNQAALFLPVNEDELRAEDENLKPQLDKVETYSAQETLRQKDFGIFTREEIEQAKRLMRALPWEIGLRETRRRERGGSEALDWRRTLRQNVKYGGEMVALARTQPRTKPRPLVVLCDISGSMENYSRLFLQFIHALRGSYANVESFVFSTRLTRITRQLRTRDIEIALRDVSRVVEDWSGGTRIGDAIKTFNFRWARRVLRPGAVVLIISDGWDRGDTELLRREMERLRRNVYRIIWLNPLIASPEYQPLTLGLQAALPYVDDFLPAHNLASLEDLARRLSALDETQIPSGTQLRPTR